MKPSGNMLRLHTIAVSTALAAVILGNQAGEAGSTIHKVGAVTRHAAQFVGTDLVLEGYVLASEPGYVLFSDEATGKISAHDLPVSGPGVETMQTMKKYTIEGLFLDHGLKASNGSPYHLELSAAPSESPR